MALMEPVLDRALKLVLRINHNACTMVGLCAAKLAASNKYLEWTANGNLQLPGLYAITWDGWAYTSGQPPIAANFKFDSGDVLELQWDPKTRTLTYFSLDTKAKHQQKIYREYLKFGELHFCVGLTGASKVGSSDASIIPWEALKE